MNTLKNIESYEECIFSFTKESFENYKKIDILEKELEIKDALVKEWQARANKKKMPAKKATVLRAEKMLVELEHKGVVR